jgi:hypothetical protein
MYSIDNNKKILYNVASCWLYLKEYIKDARSHERQIPSMPLYDLHICLYLPDSVINITLFHLVWFDRNLVRVIISFDILYVPVGKVA